MSKACQYLPSGKSLAELVDAQTIWAWVRCDGRRWEKRASM
jgi:hypothetical protein